MRYLASIVVLAFILIVLSAFPAAAVNCGSSADNLGTDFQGTQACAGQDSFVKRVRWGVYWRDGYSADVYVVDQGRSRYWVDILQH